MHKFSLMTNVLALAIPKPSVRSRLCLPELGAVHTRTRLPQSGNLIRTQREFRGGSKRRAKRQEGAAAVEEKIRLSFKWDCIFLKFANLFFFQTEPNKLKKTES